MFEKYREKCQTELFLKWIKQYLNIKTFYGTTMNAVFRQIWIAIFDFLMLIISKNTVYDGPVLYTIINSIGQLLIKRGNTRDIFNQPTLSDYTPEREQVNQITLW